MVRQTRAASPAPSLSVAKVADEVSERTNGDAASTVAKKAEEPTFSPPPRPPGLRSTLLLLYGALTATVIFFALVGLSLSDPVAEGKYRIRNTKAIINIEDFDASELGPYPKCHPHYGEHKTTVANGSQAWVRNDAVSSNGPFPVGHPENPEWVTRSTAEARQELLENRFTWQGLQPPLHLLALAVLTVAIGCLHAVWLFTEPRSTEESQQLSNGSPAIFSSEEAKWVPIVGSCSLCSIFVIYKYFGTDLVKFLFTCFILCICVGGIGTNVKHFTALVRNKGEKPLFHIPSFAMSVTAPEFFGVCIGSAMAAAFMPHKNWLLNNMFGLSFCVLGIKSIGINSYKTGAIFLSGLFFYDIFWVFCSKSVFGSNVMVTVAKGVEGPIKLMFPRGAGGCGLLEHSMLGLGDIVVPGFFMAFLAKWDAARLDASFLYLRVTMVSYFFSLATTVVIMLLFQAAQPALLYIVPYVLTASAGLAVARGEFKELLSYNIPDETSRNGCSEVVAEKKAS